MTLNDILRKGRALPAIAGLALAGQAYAGPGTLPRPQIVPAKTCDTGDVEITPELRERICGPEETEAPAPVTPTPAPAAPTPRRTLEEDVCNWDTLAEKAGIRPLSTYDLACTTLDERRALASDHLTLFYATNMCTGSGDRVCTAYMDKPEPEVKTVTVTVPGEDRVIRVPVPGETVTVPAKCDFEAGEALMDAEEVTAWGPYITGSSAIADGEYCVTLDLSKVTDRITELEDLLGGETERANGLAEDLDAARKDLEGKRDPIDRTRKFAATLGARYVPRIVFNDERYGVVHVPEGVLGFEFPLRKGNAGALRLSLSGGYAGLGAPRPSLTTQLDPTSTRNDPFGFREHLVGTDLYLTGIVFEDTIGTRTITFADGQHAWTAGVGVEYLTPTLARIPGKKGSTGIDISVGGRYGLIRNIFPQTETTSTETQTTEYTITGLASNFPSGMSPSELLQSEYLVDPAQTASTTFDPVLNQGPVEGYMRQGHTVGVPVGFTFRDIEGSPVSVRLGGEFAWTTGDFKGYGLHSFMSVAPEVGIDIRLNSYQPKDKE